MNMVHIHYVIAFSFRCSGDTLAATSGNRVQTANYRVTAHTTHCQHDAAMHPHNPLPDIILCVRMCAFIVSF